MSKSYVITGRWARYGAPAASIEKDSGGSSNSHTRATHASFCGGATVPQRCDPGTLSAASSDKVTTTPGATAPGGRVSRTFCAVPLYLLIRNSWIAPVV